MYAKPFSHLLSKSLRIFLMFNKCFFQSQKFLQKKILIPKAEHLVPINTFDLKKTQYKSRNHMLFIVEGRP